MGDVLYLQDPVWIVGMQSAVCGLPSAVRLPSANTFTS